MFLIFAFLVRVRLSSLFFFSLDVTCCALSTVFFVCLFWTTINHSVIYGRPLGASIADCVAKTFHLGWAEALNSSQHG